MPLLRLGVDLGGTKIEIIALDAKGDTRFRCRIATPQGDYRATLLAIAGLVQAAEVEIGQRGSVGLGIPGAESATTGRIKNANSTCLIGQPLRDDLQRLLEREVRIANDANCFALSEAVDGAGQGADLVFGAILGTGVGGGIVIGERVLTGANRIAGEWGHNPLPPEDDALPAAACYCGRRGCIETWLSGPALTRDHLRHGGASLAPDEIGARAAAGDALCEASLRRYENRLARALAQVINTLDPDVIVLGGGLSRLERLYSRVPALWTPYVFSDQMVTRLLPPRHGDASGVRGAAWLWGRA
jgi:predicted NBD/HSP70 family sugar kinase